MNANEQLIMHHSILKQDKWLNSSVFSDNGILKI